MGLYLRMLTSYLLLLTPLLVKPPARISIHVDKTVMYAGSDIVVTCVVPRHPDNRTLDVFLVPDIARSERQLNGDDETTLVTNRFEFKRIPADVQGAVCRLIDKYARYADAVQSLQVRD